MYYSLTDVDTSLKKLNKTDVKADNNNQIHAPRVINHFCLYLLFLNCTMA